MKANIASYPARHRSLRCIAVAKNPDANRVTNQQPIGRTALQQQQQHAAAAAGVSTAEPRHR